MVVNDIINYMAKRGRKKKPAQLRLTEQISLRLSKAERKRLETESLELGMSIQQYIRFMLIKGKN